MDEYLFIAMAKLKADRQRLEREQKAEHTRSLPLEPPVFTADARRKAAPRSITREWRAQS